LTTNSFQSAPLVAEADQTRPTGYLPTLDGWRAIAIFGVIICHGSDALFSPGGSSPNGFWYGLTRYGALGVDVFFGISGFLICSRLLSEERRDGRISLKKFYIRRALRILPPYFFYLTVIGALSIFGLVIVNRWDLVSCLFFFRNYLSPLALGSWYTGHFWSLSIEEHFYLLLPGLLVLCGSRRARPVVISLALAIALWRFVEFRQQWLARLLPGVGFYMRTDIRLDGLLWGCWLALMLVKEGWRDRLTRWLSPSVWLVLVATFIVCVYRQPPFAMLWQSVLLPFILVGTVLRPGNSLGRFLETAPLRWVGRISYSLYLWQQLFLASSAAPRASRLLQSLPFNLVAVLACAMLSYYLVERPMIGLGHRWSSRGESKALNMVRSGPTPDELYTVMS
jgi:peptidoglycan/LPS O-acetylase OafA/YrhL